MVAARGARWIRTLVAPSRTWQRVPEEASKRKLLHSDEALRRAQALFRKEQQAREGEQAMAEHQAERLGLDYCHHRQPSAQRHLTPRALTTAAPRRPRSLITLRSPKCVSLDSR